MKLNDVIARIPYWYAAKKCVYLKSAPGRGKTSVLSAAPEILSRATGKTMGLVVINGGLLTPADSIGYLIPRKVTTNGVERTESAYTEPFWFRTKEGKHVTEFQGGIIVIDEMDKADVDVKKVIGEAALSGRLGPHAIPEGWVLWMAGNRQQDRSGSTKELDHLINRRMEIDIMDDIVSWTDWAQRADVSALTITFANQHPDIVFSKALPEKQGPWATPRSVVECDRFLKQFMDDEGNLPEDELLMEEAASMIGDAATATLFSFVKLQREMPAFADIIANPDTAKRPDKPDAQMLVCYNLAQRVTDQNAGPVIQYVNRLPKEFGVVYGKASIDRNPKLIVHPAYTAWIKQNASLMASIGSR